MIDKIKAFSVEEGDTVRIGGQQITVTDISDEDGDLTFEGLDEKDHFITISTDWDDDVEVIAWM